MAAEEDEWARANRAVAYKRRAVVVAVIAGFIACGLGFWLVAWYAESVDTSTTMISHNARGRPSSPVFVMIGGPVLFGAAVYYAVYRLMGGVVSAEHTRGLRG